MCDIPSVLGYLFDAFQLLTSVADEVTNVWVLVDFYNADQTTFFGLVLTVLIISSILNSIGFCLRMEKHLCCGRPREWYEWVGAVIFFAVFAGPLLPSIQFFCTKLFDLDSQMSKHNNVNWNELDFMTGKKKDDKQNEEKDDAEEKETDDNSNDAEVILPSYSPATGPPKSSADDNLPIKPKPSKQVGNNKNTPEVGNAAAELFQNEVRISNASLGLLDNAVTRRFGSFLLLNGQALYSSTLQSVIQLIAASIVGGKPTMIQTTSLSLSLFSLSLKSYQLARSFTIPAFFWKIALMCFDLFSSMFIFASLLSSTSEKEVGLFGSHENLVNKLSAGWIYTKLVVIVFDLTACIVGFIALLFEGSPDCTEMCARIAACTLGFVLLAAPALVAQETIKLSFLVLASFRESPPFDSLPQAAFLHAFLHSGSGEQRPETVDWIATFVSLRAYGTEVLRNFIDKRFKPLMRRQRKKETGFSDTDSETKAKNGDGDDGNGEDENNQLNNNDGAAAPAAVSGVSFAARRPRQGKQRRNNNNNSSASTPQNPGPSERLQISRPLEIESWHALARRTQRPLMPRDAVEQPDDFFARVRHLKQLSELDNARRQIIMSLMPVNKAMYSALRNQLQSHERRILYFQAEVDGALRSPLTPPNYHGKITMEDIIPSFFGNSTFSCQDCCDTLQDLCKVCKECCRWEVVVGLFVFLAELTSIVMGILYPILYAAMYWPAIYASNVQLICWTAAMASLFVIIILSPSMWRYHRTCQIYHSMGSTFAYLDLPRIVDLYFSVPISIVQAAAVPSMSVPEDAFVRHVLPFLDERMCGCYGLAMSEHHKLQQVFRETVAAQKQQGNSNDDAVAQVLARQPPPSAAAADGEGAAVLNPLSETQRYGSTDV